MPEEVMQMLTEIKNELNKPKIKFLKRKDIQKLLRYSEATITALFRREDFPAIVVGKAHVVEESAFIEWCKQRRA